MKLLTRSPLYAALPAVLAAILAGVRYAVQGSGNTWTKLEMRFYVPDPDTGYRAVRTDVIWLGLEAIGLVAGVVVGLGAAAWLIGRIERKRGGKPWLVPRVATWIAAVATLVVPIAAFASGGAPANAIDRLPVGTTAAAPTEGFDGGLALPAGTYRVAKGSSITATLTAGKETFDARFEGDFAGTWTGAFDDFGQPVKASFSVAAASVDAGIALRSQHARDEYLYAGKFPRIGFDLTKLVATRLDGDQLVFRAQGTISLMGATLPAEVTGKAKAADAAARTRLGLGSEPALVVQADTELSIKASPLVADVDSFDVDRVPIHVVLVLAKTE